VANGIGNAVGVQHTETSLIIWSGTPVSEITSSQTNSRSAISTAPAAIFQADQFYNAGDKGCAFGPMDEIAAMMQKIKPGQTIEIYATDPTVATDLSAWCRMTNHKLIEQQGSHYLIQHKD
jgi:TusA-related sulfurtransferase